MRKKVKKAVSRVSKDDLYKNSTFLIMNGAVLAILGFVFWVIVARLYSVEDIGLASTMISLMSLFIAISSLGFNISFLKYLPREKNKLSIIHPCFMISSAVMFTLSILFLLIVENILPDLGFLTEHIGYSIGFVIFMTIAPMFNLIENVFIAKRETHYVLLKSLIWSILKICFPFFIVFGAFGIYAGWGIATIIALLVCLALIHYTPAKSDWKKVKKMFKFSAGNYLANLFIIATFMGMPIFVTIMLGPEATGYFYIPWMIALSMFMLPQAVGKVLLAQANRSKNRKLLAKALKFTYILLVPAVIALLIIGKYLLLAFGEGYAKDSYTVLVILLISSFLFSFHALVTMFYNITNHIKRVVIMNFSLTLLTYIFSYYLISTGLGIVGISIAWMLANLASLIFVYPLRKEGS